MSKSNTLEADILKLILQGIPIAGLAANAVAGIAFVSVAAHIADPGDGGSQLTNEATYTGYARSSIPRSPAAWTVSGTAPTTAVLNTQMDWPQSLQAASQTLTHFSIGMPGVGGTAIFYSGALVPNIVVGLGVVPGLQAGVTQIQED